MKKMLNNLQNDLGISHSDTKEVSRPILQLSSASVESLDPRSPHMNQSGNDQERDLLKQYEEKLTQDESLPLTPQGQSSKGTDVLNSSKEDQEHRVQEFGVKSNESWNPGSSSEGDDLVEEKTKKISELQKTAVGKPVPRPRRKNSTTNLVSNISSSDLPSVLEKPEAKSISVREVGTENTNPKSRPENSNGIGSQNSDVSKMFSGRTAEEHRKHTDATCEGTSNFGSKPNSMEMKKDSPKSEISVSPQNNQKDKSSSHLKTPEEDNYDDDFEDDNDSDFWAEFHYVYIISSYKVITLSPKYLTTKLCFI